MTAAVDINQEITGKKDGVTIKNYKTNPRLSKIFLSTSLLRCGHL